MNQSMTVVKLVSTFHVLKNSDEFGYGDGVGLQVEGIEVVHQVVEFIAFASLQTN